MIPKAMQFENVFSPLSYPIDVIMESKPASFRQVRKEETNVCVYMGWVTTTRWLSGNGMQFALPDTTSITPLSLKE